jgi:hypothetical protein
MLTWGDQERPSVLRPLHKEGTKYDSVIMAPCQERPLCPGTWGGEMGVMGDHNAYVG